MKVDYKEYGKGIPLVLIHGFAADNMVWKGIALSLYNAHIFCPDLPCIGHSEGVVEQISLEYAASQIKELMDINKIPQAFIVGHSMGGYIAQSFAQLYPEKILGIGLIHSTPLADSEEKKNNRKKSADFIIEHGREKFLSMAIPGWFATENREKYANEIEQLVDTAMQIEDKVLYQYQMAIAERKDFKSWFQNFEKSKLLVLGKNDDLIPYREHEYLYQYPNINLHLIDHCGHASMIEQKEQLIAILSQWISMS